MQSRRMLFFLLGLIFLAAMLLINRWPTNLHYGDSNGYYLHVVSFWVNQDVGSYDQSISSLLEVNPQGADPRTDKYGIRLTDQGRRYIKYTLGVPVMETPFFLLAHGVALLLPQYAANGWTAPYAFLLGLSTIVYILLGLWLLLRVLERYFSSQALLLTVLTLCLASNLFYHATYVTMAHGFLFFQHGLLIFLSDRFYREPSRWRALGLGLVVGLITLTRVPELISILVPLLWGITGKAAFFDRLRFFSQHFTYLLLALLGLMISFSPQLAYWYFVSGQFIFNPYEGEGFNFLHPKVYEGFFHFRNGWLMYSPLMILSVLGFFWLPRYAKAVFWSVLCFFLLHIWVHYSYYAWSYFPGLGSRPMVDAYPLLSFPLAAMYTQLGKSRSWRWSAIGALVLFSTLNLFQTWQMKKGVIWSERHNAAFYWATFGTMQPTLNSLRAYDTKELQPREAKIDSVKTIRIENFEESKRFAPALLSNAYVKEGQQSFRMPAEPFVLVEKLSLPEIKPGDWLKLSAYAYTPGSSQVFNRDYCMNLILELYDEKGRRRKERNIKISTHIGNTRYSIWTTGSPDQWGKGSFYVRVPRRWQPDWTAKIRLTNPYSQEIYLDQLALELYHSK